MNAPIIEFYHRSFRVKSIAKATELAKLMSELVEVEFKHSPDYGKSWYEEVDPDGSGLEVKLQVSKEVRKRPARLGLPAPKRGSILCICGRATVRQGESCPSCDLPFHAICEAAQRWRSGTPTRRARRRNQTRRVRRVGVLLHRFVSDFLKQPTTKEQNDKPL
jgi:hypothetical protein